MGNQGGGKLGDPTSIFAVLTLQSHHFNQSRAGILITGSVKVDMWVAPEIAEVYVR